MKKILEFLGETILTIIIIVLCVLILLVAKGYHPSICGYQILRVITGSMAPEIEQDTVILIRKTAQEDLKVGDVITFESTDPSLQGMYNTHRIVEIRVSSTTGEIQYITKGDSNSSVDAYPVTYDRIAGRLVREIPFGNLIGKGLAKLTDGRYYFLIVLLPLFLCLISYIWQAFGILSKDQEEEGEKDEEKS